MYSRQCPLEPHLEGPFCRYHSRGFEVRRSTIPNAGRGLFAAKHIYEGDLIGIYRGELIDAREFERRYGNAHATYVWQTLYDDVFINARHEQSCLERYANDGTLLCLNNVEPEIDGAVVSFRALEDIAPGTEIMYCYGADYPLPDPVPVNDD